ncbi:hypothetical protein B7Z17_05320 [Candidatus Saccharibacteria bacterium 32-49-10]|nr:MAG: hypothetical protein B7Z17_05320 [Candidatus Saccharibacteria bacterium 32-49-10]
MDDRIQLSVATSDEELSTAIAEHGEVIAAETLADEIAAGEFAHTSDVKIEGVDAKVSLEAK